MTEGEGETLRFIIDEPAPVDFFKTHSRVADAITRALRTNRSLKIIGLIGRWGSGKSTIVREVERKLEESDSTFLTFTYDAWLHQHDPLRRSFLESLVEFLAVRDHIDRATWKKELNHLSGAIETTNQIETPIVTSEAKIFFILAFLIPIGVSMLGRETFAAALGSTRTQAGVWTFALGLSLILGPALFWVGRFLCRRLWGAEATLFPALIFNRTLGHKTIHVQKNPEPSSIEFGQVFRNLMLAVYKKNVRIVIIIDNIDRVDEEEAMQLWASIRSFFLSHSDDNSIETEKYHPTVILPIDAQSIGQMFAVGSDREAGERLARSFINKTFDVTFDVPAPVISDWKRYLGEKMNFCLGSEYNEHRFFRTRQFLESWFEWSKTPITPREINKALNRIVALLMQWRHSEITFDSIAYFSINRDRISEAVEAEIGRADHPLMQTTPNWALEIAALHFGVSVDDAAQVLMTTPIREAILNRDSSELVDYRKLAGFGDTFERVTRELPEDEHRPAPHREIICNAAALLANEDDTGPWYAASWKNLITTFGNSSGILKHPFTQISPMIPHIENADAASFLSNSVDLIDETISANIKNSTISDEIGNLGLNLIKLSEQSDLSPPIFDFSGNLANYLDRLESLSLYPSVQRRLRCRVSPSDIVTNLMERMNNPRHSLYIPKLIDLFTSKSAAIIIREPIGDLSNLITVAETIARANGGDTALFRGAIQTIVAPRVMEEAQRTAIGALAQDGILAAQLNATMSSGDGETLSIMIASIIIKKGSLSSISSSWSAFFADQTDMPGRINEMIDRLLDDQQQIDILSSYFDEHYWLRDLVRTLMDDRVQRGNLGHLDSARVLGNFYHYSRMISRALHQDFIAELSKYEKFWSNVQTMDWNRNTFVMAVELRRTGGAAAERLEVELRERVLAASVSDWRGAIESGDEPLRIATEFLDGPALKQGVNSSLVDALVESALIVTSSRKEARERWFQLAEILTPAGRKKAMEAMGLAVISAAPTAKLKTLTSGGTRLLSEAGFGSQPDEFIESVIIPLTRLRSGRAWLADRRTTLRSSIDAAGSKTHARLVRIVTNMEKSSHDDRKQWAEAMIKSWRIKD